MKISKFGNKITSKSGISILMDDLGEALTTRTDMIMLGGGNPAHIPQVQAEFRRCLSDLLKDKSIFNCAFGNYDPPTGNIDFINSLCILLNNQFGWDITPQNIALTNGSQTAFFVLFNLFAGLMQDGSLKKILLPLAPEYIGYSDVGITENMFSACRPEIRILDNGMFKYCIDFDRLEITDDIGAMCVSRPTNPTGNVLTDEELYALSELAEQNDIPLIIDNAYGTPFPNIIFSDANPVFNKNTIVCMSLSKLGLPAVRTGIIIAQPNVIEMIREFNAVVSLSPGGIGPAMTHQLFSSGKIIDICRNMIKPYYQQKAERTVKILQEKLSNVDFLIHKPEGALFLWLWFRDLPITCRQLYEKLKENGVLVVPGNFFFPGLEDDDWNHKNQCIRLNYSQDSHLVEKGIDIMAKVINNT